MEKLASVLWKPADQPDQAFADALLAAAPELAKQGAMKLRIDVADDAVADGAGVRVGRMDPPKAAVVFYWLDLADDRGPVEAVLAPLASRVETFLVVEAEPVKNTAHVAPLGRRTPGFNFVTCIQRKPGLSDAEFLSHWHVEHRRCAVETQSTFAYVRNEIVRAYSDTAPAWEAIVEESFPIEALTDPKVWYAAKDDAQLAKNRGWMIESCLAFLALDQVEGHPMSEYVFQR
ncbi:MAG: hypothetical protein ACQGVC_25140 [Myxococcota bacterium]